MGNRSEKRITAIYPIRLWGMDANGRPFIEAATTLNVSRTGVLLKDVPAKLAVGDVIALKSGEQKCRFRIVWIGQAGTSEAGHLGLQSLQPHKYIWNLKLPAPAIDIYTRPQQCERRLSRRLRCSVSAQVRSGGSADSIRAFITDVSLGGCYISMSAPFALEAKLAIAIWLDECTKIWADGIVISNHQGYGIGVKFLNLSHKNLDDLKNFLELLPEPQSSASAITPAGWRERIWTKEK